MATPNSIAVFNYLKSNFGKNFSKQEIAEALGISLASVTGAVNAYTKKGLVVKTGEEVVELEPATETRKAKTKTVVYHTLAETGLTYDPVEEDARKAAEKEAEKAAKAAARAAAKAAKEAE